jgi:hypothetical protein
MKFIDWINVVPAVQNGRTFAFVLILFAAWTGYFARRWNSAVEATTPASPSRQSNFAQFAKTSGLSTASPLSRAVSARFPRCKMPCGKLWREPAQR